MRARRCGRGQPSRPDEAPEGAGSESLVEVMIVMIISSSSSSSSSSSMIISMIH